MIEAVDVGLQPSPAPVSDAVRAGKLVWLVAIPEDPATGAIVPGDIGVQTAQLLRNLRRGAEAAGGSLRQVTQVQVFLIDRADAAGMNAVYAAVFAPPYPVRATVVVKELLGDGMRVEMLAQMVLD